MNAIQMPGRSVRIAAWMLALVLGAWTGAGAQNSNTKKPASAPAKSAAPAKAPAGGASHPATSSHGPTTAGASHGPTTAGASHGPTTAGGASHGPTTAGGSRGATTAGAGHTTTAGGANAGRGPGAAGSAHGPANANNRMSNGRAVPAGNRVTRSPNGNEIRTRANGRPADVHIAGRGMDVHHGLDGSRRVSVERADHSRIVADRRGRGYVQHPYMYHGHEFAHRTYYRDGRAYDRFYRRYPYHGVYVEAYAPSFYYAPAFYGWAYNPWPAPVVYSWGFAATPWFGFYGGYFAPYPVYPSASLWLTDYLISQSLAAAYADQQAAAQAQASQAAAADYAAAQPAPLTPDVKQEIADEVQRQIALENQEAQTAAQNNEPDPGSSGIQRMLTDGVRHVFVAGANVDVTDANGTECTVGEGDALQLTGEPVPPDATAANLVMLSSKGGHDCAKGDTVSVGFTDLQDMQNSMRETISTGMNNLQTNQGKGGLPTLPPSAKAAPVKADFTNGAPPPDADAANQINQQAQGADQAEQEALNQAPQGADASAGENAGAAAAPAGPPKTIAVGQSIDDVVASMGQPKSIVDLGAKKIYVYPDLKITFNNGKVSNVQ
jgi:hypothetical protein